MSKSKVQQYQLARTLRLLTEAACCIADELDADMLLETEVDDLKRNVPICLADADALERYAERQLSEGDDD